MPPQTCDRDHMLKSRSSVCPYFDFRGKEAGGAGEGNQLLEEQDPWCFFFFFFLNTAELSKYKSPHRAGGCLGRWFP